MPDSTRVRFGEFEVNLRTGEVRKRGIRLRMAEQPFQVLASLLAKPGELVTREELREKLWPDGTFGDFDHGVTKAVNRIREVLGDSAESPLFVETVPRRGYRFVGAAEFLNGTGSVADAASPSTDPVRPDLAANLPPRPTKHLSLWTFTVIASVIILAAAGIWAARHWGGSGPSNRIRTVAVLPLQNLSHDPQEEYFADGMTDELIYTLAKVGALRVTSRASVLQFKGTKKPMPEIANQLGVDAVVEGTVLRSGGRVRITVQLIDARTDTHIWAESYERDMRNVLTVQEEITRAVAGAIRVQLNPQEKKSLERAQQVAPEAQEAYLKGLYYWSKVSDGGCEKGIEYFREAIQKAPDYAAAYAGLANCYAHLSIFGAMPATEAYPKAKEAALKALALDNSLAEAHAIVGSVLFFYEWNWPAAETEYQRSIELNPGYAAVHMYYSGLLLMRHEKQKALEELREARTLDPLGQTTNVSIAYQLRLAHEFDLAIDQLHRVLDLYPDLGVAHYFLAMNFHDKGQPALAAEEWLKAQTSWGATPDELVVFQRAYARSGIQGIFEERAKQSRNQGRKASDISVMSAYAGENELALQYLERGYRERDDGMVKLRIEPAFEGLRTDARFQDLVRRIGLP